MSLVGFQAGNHPQQIGRRGALAEVDDRGTDPAFFAALEARFGPFDLDVAAAEHNAKCPHWYGRAEDGLTQPWRGQVWCNPPYSDIGAWVAKAWEEWHGSAPPGPPREHYIQHACDGAPYRIVMLLPANRTEQAWWQDLVEPHLRARRPDFTVEFLRGRMRFDRPGAVIGPKGDRPPFGCALLIWCSDPLGPPLPRCGGAL